jgi:ATP-dependent 26S proteasome regulatory subunit
MSWETYVVGGVILVLAVSLAVGLTWHHFKQYRESLAHIILQHLGQGDWRKGEVLSHIFSPSEGPNLQLMLDDWRRQPGTQGPFGIPFVHNISWLIERQANQPRLKPMPVTSNNLPRALGETLPCVNNGLYLLRHDGQPFCCIIVNNRLDVMSLRQGVARAALAALLATAHRLSVYRGAVVTLDAHVLEPDGTPRVRFHDIAAVEPDSIILPGELLEVLQRNVVGFFARMEALRRAGRGTRHGVLLHGPPGVGKTLVTRYVARACPGVTVLLLTAYSLQLIRFACRLARLLAPSLVVLEDVDLIAGDRRQQDNPLLHELMDEMDGLGNNPDCIFLLTTNRPEALEPALASRPGRVDQAIFFPLPDRVCRQRLFALMGKGLDMQDVDLEPWLDRTEGASPAFLQEFMRKAVLMALERNGETQPLRLRPEDLERALRELVAFGGELTRNLLGFRRDQGVGFRNTGQR